MIRQTVYRYEEQVFTDGPMFLGINVNNEIGLDAFLDYTLSEHLEALAEEEGLVIVSVVGDVHTFSDGSQQILQQRVEDIDLTSLDSETVMLLIASL